MTGPFLRILHKGGGGFTLTFFLDYRKLWNNKTTFRQSLCAFSDVVLKQIIYHLGLENQLIK